jgi:polar amino acid transport system substrate-binding protein
VDDDVALVPLAEEPDLEIGFSVPTQNNGALRSKREMRLRLAHVNEGPRDDQIERPTGTALAQMDAFAELPFGTR